MYIHAYTYRYDYSQKAQLLLNLQYKTTVELTFDKLIYQPNDEGLAWRPRDWCASLTHPRRHPHSLSVPLLRLCTQVRGGFQRETDTVYVDQSHPRHVARAIFCFFVGFFPKKIPHVTVAPRCCRGFFGKHTKKKEKSRETRGATVTAPSHARIHTRCLSLFPVCVYMCACVCVCVCVCVCPYVYVFLCVCRSDGAYSVSQSHRMPYLHR